MLMHMGVCDRTVSLLAIKSGTEWFFIFLWLTLRHFYWGCFKAKEFSNMTQELIPARQATKQKIPMHFKAFVAINTTTSILVYPTLGCHSSCERPRSHHNMLLQQTKGAEIWQEEPRVQPLFVSVQYLTSSQHTVSFPFSPWPSTND